jgi:protein N-terminal methyltransferase
MAADAQINHQDARNYWEGIDADVNGMLGGFPYISRVDLQGSKNFLAKLGVGGKGRGKVGRAVDCGAGFVIPTPTLSSPASGLSKEELGKDMD